MKRGKKYFNKDVVYVSFKKHLCPNCSNKLKKVKVSKTVNFHSAEADNYDFRFGSGKHILVINDDVEFVWKEFDCPNCKTHFTVDELKKIEGIELTDENKNGLNNRNTVKDLIVFFLIGIFIAVIVGLFKMFTR